MLILTDENFEENVRNAVKPLIVDVYANWCPPCKMLGPIMDKLDAELKDKVTFAKLNLDENHKIGTALSIDRIPTVFLYINGKMTNSFSGFKSEADLIQWINLNI